MRTIRKYIILLFTGILGIITFSCSDFLDTTSGSQLTDNEIYQNEGDIYRAILNIYAQISEEKLYGRTIPLIYSFNTDIEFGTCNATPDNTRRGIWDYSATIDNEELVSWDYIYKAINTANECIAGIESSPLLEQNPADTPSMIRQLYGEAKGLRAMLYLDLVRAWGDVPFKMTPTMPDDNFYQGVTSRTEILETLINDLIAVEPGMLYASEMSQSVERMNRGAVQGLIARIALTLGGYTLMPDYANPSFPGTIERVENYIDYYEIANTYCRKLRDSRKHTLANTDFLQVFKNQCEEVYPSNEDMLFEIPYATTYSGSVGVIIGHKIEGSSHIAYGKSDGWYYATLPYHASFDYKDARRDVTCAPYKWAWNDEKGYIEQVFTEWRSIYIGKWSRMWMKTPQGPNVQYSSGINWPVIRYADVLLMLAETENELHNGPTDDARDALKEVRRRAFKTEDHVRKVDAYVDALDDKDAFFEALVNERAWEFGGEGIRKYDLIRWNLLQKKIQEMKVKLAEMKNNSAYPQSVYVKTNNDGTLEILNFDNSLSNAPSGYTKKAWASATTDNNGVLNTTFVKSYKDEYIDATPMVYILPLHKDVITDSRGALQNYYGH